MLSEDRDAHTGIPHANRDTPGSFKDLRTKVEAMARMSFQIYHKQKDYRSMIYCLPNAQNWKKIRHKQSAMFRFGPSIVEFKR
eukprot:3598521-Amphidinium_carterae.1